MHVKRCKDSCHTCLQNDRETPKRFNLFEIRLRLGFVPAEGWFILAQVIVKMLLTDP